MNTIDKIKNLFKTKGKIIIPISAIIIILCGSTFAVIHNKKNVSTEKTEIAEKKEKQVSKAKKNDNASSTEKKEGEEKSNTTDKEKITEQKEEEKAPEVVAEQKKEEKAPEVATEQKKEEKAPEPKPEPKPEVNPEPKPEPKPEVNPGPVAPEPKPEPKPEPVQSYPSTSEVQQRLINYGQSIGLVYDSSLLTNGFELQGSQQIWSSERGNSPDRWLVDGVKSQNYKSFAISVTDLGNGFCSIGVYVSMYE